MRPFLRVEYERRARRLSQHDLARLSGISQPDIIKIEHGRLTPKPEQLERLAQALLISPPDVLLKPVQILRPDEEVQLVEETARP